MGLLILHVDDAIWAGEGPLFKQAQDHIRKEFKLSKENMAGSTSSGAVSSRTRTSRSL